MSEREFESKIDRLLGRLRDAGYPLDLDPPNLGCPVPPAGWWCSREPGHEGPCAARPEIDHKSVSDGDGNHHRPDLATTGDDT